VATLTAHKRGLAGQSQHVKGSREKCGSNEPEGIGEVFWGKFPGAESPKEGKCIGNRTQCSFHRVKGHDSRPGGGVVVAGLQGGAQTASILLKREIRSHGHALRDAGEVGQGVIEEGGEEDGWESKKDH